jgi:hypothetical protein
VLRWAREQYPPCPWFSTVCSTAAGRGHLELMKWAWEHGCPWNADETMRSALDGGDDEMLLWITMQGLGTIQMGYMTRAWTQ